MFKEGLNTKFIMCHLCCILHVVYISHSDQNTFKREYQETLKMAANSKHSRFKMPSPQRGCQSLSQNLPGNTDSKNYGNSEKKIGNLVKLYQKYLEMWHKTVNIFWNLMQFLNLYKVRHSDLLYGGGPFLSERAQYKLIIS